MMTRIAIVHANYRGHRAAATRWHDNVRVRSQQQEL